MNVRRALLWLGASIVALLLLAAVAVYWASRSETVLRWGIDRFAPALPCALTVEGLMGLGWFAIANPSPAASP